MSSDIGNTLNMATDTVSGVVDSETSSCRERVATRRRPFFQIR